ARRRGKPRRRFRNFFLKFFGCGVVRLAAKSMSRGCRAHKAARANGLEEVEILFLLPRRRLGGILCFRLEARELGVLEVRVIIDESRAEAFAEAVVGAQRGERLAEVFRQ